MNIGRSVKILLALVVAVLGPGLMAAKADTVWTLNDVDFNRPGYGTNAASGTITFNSTFTGLDAWDVTVTGTNTQANAVYENGTGGGYLDPSDTGVDLYDSGFAQYLDLVFASALTNSGGTVDLSVSGTLACPGCGTLVSGTLSTDPVATPEAGSLSLLACGLFGLGLLFVKRRVVLN
jgi:hypothetical protein